MKKIYNSIPLQSVLYVTPGLLPIRVEDLKMRFWEMPKEIRLHKIVYEGYAKDIGYTPILYSKLCGIDIDNDTLVFQICTAEERNI